MQIPDIVHLPQTLRNDLPKKAKKSKKSNKFQSSAFSQQKLGFGSSLQTQDASDGEEEDDDGPPGPLIEASFHRVILDEVRVHST